jgi:hypothetical protein
MLFDGCLVEGQRVRRAPLNFHQTILELSAVVVLLGQVLDCGKKLQTLLDWRKAEK